MVSYEWRGSFRNDEVAALHAEGFGHPPDDDDWLTQLGRHSLGWACARQSGRLVGFVNVAWNGGGIPADRGRGHRAGRAGNVTPGGPASMS